MIEDESLNRCVKAALESGEPFHIRLPLAERPRRSWRWSVPALAAASVALAVVVWVTVPPRPDPMADAIALLSEADGVEVVPGERVSSAELLLAWQDAPCRGSL